MKQYLELVSRILTLGEDRMDRTGVGTRGIFGAQLRFDLSQGFPLLTTKKMFVKGIIHELLWFLSGSTSVKPLQDAGVKIWDAWATKEQCAKFGREAGDLGPVYGHQWRHFGSVDSEEEQAFDPVNYAGKKRYRPEDGFDQIAWVIDEIKKNPASRRLVVTAWNPEEAQQVALPPCHTLFQFYVQDDQRSVRANPAYAAPLAMMNSDTRPRLDCHLYMRSADVFLGVPFNIASYALLTAMVAHQTGTRPGNLIVSFGDVHLYSNHFEQAKEQLKRKPRALPVVMFVKNPPNIFEYTFDDFCLLGYDPHPAIAAEVAI